MESSGPRGLVARLVVHPSDNPSIQFFRYAIVGGLATAADVGTFYVANSILGWHYLAAQTAGFVIGLAVNYALSIRWVFRSTGRVGREIALFAAIGVAGLLLSYAMLWLLIDIARVRLFRNMVAKLITTLVVLAWNFGMRRQFVFRDTSRSLPSAAVGTSDARQL
jgi:putative flippase GtrA